jgi:hypothetical protein
MGARRFGPDISKFLQQDVFYTALGNLGLALDPLTQNRYSLAGGNPISYVEFDGHMVLADGGGGSSPSPNPTASRDSLTNAWHDLQGFFGEGPKADQAPSWMKTALQWWDDLETASATNIGADRAEQDAAADRLANTTLGKFVGIADAPTV